MLEFSMLELQVEVARTIAMTHTILNIFEGDFLFDFDCFFICFLNPILLLLNWPILLLYTLTETDIIGF